MKPSSLGAGVTLLLPFPQRRSCPPCPRLEQELDSAGFVEKLVAEKAAFAAVDGILTASMTGSADPEDRKRAAVLYADLHLAASQAADAVNNLYRLMSQDLGSLDFASSGDVVDFLQGLLPQIIPPEAMASRESFDALLDGYSVFGGEQGSDPAVPESVNLGDVAQKAVFSCLVVESMVHGSLYGTELEARDAFWAIVSGQEPPGPNGTGAFTDPFQPGTAL